MQPHIDLDEVRLILRRNDTVPDEELDQDSSRVRLERFAQQSRLELLNCHQCETANLVVVRSWYHIRRQLNVVDVDIIRRDQPLLTRKIFPSDIHVRNDTSAARSLPDESFGERCLFVCFFHNCLERRYPRFDAAGHARIEHARICVEMRRAAWDPDFRAGFIVAVSDQVCSSTCHAEESGGKSLDVDGRTVPSTRDRERLAVLPAEHVEEILLDTGCDDFPEGRVHGFGGVLSIGEVENSDYTITVLDGEAGSPWHFMNYLRQHVSMWFIVVG